MSRRGRELAGRMADSCLRNAGVRKSGGYRDSLIGFFLPAGDMIAGMEKQLDVQAGKLAAVEAGLSAVEANVSGNGNRSFRDFRLSDFELKRKADAIVSRQLGRMGVNGHSVLPPAQDHSAPAYHPERN